MHPKIRLVAVVLALATALPVAGANAAEIKLMCPAPMRTTITALVEQFEHKSPHKVTIVHTPSKTIIERITAGESFDVSILTAEATDALVKQGKIARRADYARSSIGLGVRAGSPKPDVSSLEGVKRTLLAVKSFARNEGAESGKHMLAVFDRLGIADEMKAKTKAMPVGTGYVAELVVRGEADMAAQQMPELKAVAGIDASPLPKELQQIIVFSAGLSAKPGDPKAAQELVEFLTSAEAAPVLKSKGLDPP
ncbi:substrate-binding domain-containing protein [Rhodoplanes sp. Z2-YC6860]|uniref:substrate-binding domain-containing protein n=1 Tax=Rhodoplanes sp. Z2-YC6860 TaxID=674703 RepID=UPI00078E407C|nr:substrate-binding domain-containing protein [Rhodoplanes sp. Z2-YC6860]AMN44833.1 extracellular solute-binding protein [Rhodoplanes sp. Z2-YC6860]